MGTTISPYDLFPTSRRLDSKSVELLETISVYGPRNLAFTADKVSIPHTTARYKVNRMLSQQTLFFHLNPYHTNMGLMKTVVIAEAAQGYEDLLLKCLSVNDFWIYLYRCYGPYEGCGGVWTIPVENKTEYESFLNRIKEEGLAKEIHLYRSTCFQSVPVTRRWFNESIERWTLNWGEWLDDIRRADGELPYTLKDPEDWPISVDFVDLLIIKELEKDATITLPMLAKALNMPLETIKYHYREHVKKRGLIESYQVVIHRFPPDISESLFFVFKFSSYNNLKKFALSLLDKPFATILGKILDENTLISHIFLPKIESRNFIAALSNLVREGFLKEYNYVFQDPRQIWRQTIPYQHFDGKTWNYDHAKHLEDLKKTIQESGHIRAQDLQEEDVHFYRGVQA